ncbi:E3 ubiquitin-protein ligase RNF19B-like isoform X1 [Limulus polyphemus]|uniref:RBR-type E3 ubiquitin transferase n=1 Tax=Limulus polyphemus TaxID=6850 RepID=A0ABM1SMX2_LIMPO|nr:E3 ubiquitin-protein ligase RNF19B-like isoform X1 [Limulus polyphemus]XP_022244977.1 E3 ubiquitin-protein ligase RNF19B-like isoform X1 [Limulus polyphemus]XP_022244978.1 E3 ubiquitin-protein ligase RNF19B-like isoform X1 [Limulus polyphemus]
MASASSTPFSSSISPGPRKHGFSRLSLGRIFNSNPFGRRGTGRHRPVQTETDSRSEISIVGAHPLNRNQDSLSIKGAYRLSAVGQSSDSESNSLSSARSEVVPDSTQDRGMDRLECPFCLLELPVQCFPELSSCSHRACYNCLQTYFKIEISESRVNISCPECTEPLHPNDIRMILNDEIVIAKYEDFMIRRVLVTEPDARWCPAPDCGYVVIATGCASCPKLKCDRPGCDTYFCYHCKQEWHPNQTCDAARAQRARHSPHPRSASVSFSQDSIIQKEDIKLCPCCKVLIVKMDDGSCNHMTCSVCGTEFCWLCMNEITDLHYLSPSGCTFWGKKPWSRKKKILWQLGMLVGAPVGIALIAGIAVPAIIIGIPVWVGRKLHRYHTSKNNGKHKRNLAVTTGVMASIIVSPVLAGIAVGIGVPILLAYVYGVVPISLCRSGGCGVTTSASGVRIEFDEENDLGVAADGMSVDTAASHRGVNPSIGEVSFGMSTSISMGSGSHLERVGLIRDSDRESASNTALAGSIASASLAAAQKLEVQADISSNKRLSLSSHSETASATLSLSERSANFSLTDDASTKALAGSLLGYRDTVEVHVDAQSMSEDTSLSHAIPKVGGDTTDVTSCEPNNVGSVKTDDSCNSCCCSEDGASHSSSRSFGGHRSRLWRTSGRRQQGGVSTAIVSSSIPELKQSKTQRDLREYCVSFIDESPGITEESGVRIPVDDGKGVRPKSLVSSRSCSIVHSLEATDQLCCCELKKLPTTWDDYHLKTRQSSKLNSSCKNNPKSFPETHILTCIEPQCAKIKPQKKVDEYNDTAANSNHKICDNFNDRTSRGLFRKCSDQSIVVLPHIEEPENNVKKNCPTRPRSAPYSLLWQESSPVKGGDDFS